MLGIDDGPFKRGIDTETCITGVVMRLDGTIEDISVRMLKIDDVRHFLISFFFSLHFSTRSAFVNFPVEKCVIT